MAGNDFSLARKAMVDGQIAVSSVVEPRLLSALLSVPRELFVPEHRAALAYSDSQHDIGHGRKLSSPVEFARIAQLAAIGPTDRVLDVACGTGYPSAVLSKIAASVVAYEDDKDLARIAVHNLSRIGAANASVLTQEQSALDAGPYDAMVFEGAIGNVQDTYLERLAPRGRLVAVIGAGRTGVATVWIRTADGIVSRTHFNAMLPSTMSNDAPEEFVF